MASSWKKYSKHTTLPLEACVKGRGQCERGLCRQESDHV